MDEDEGVLWHAGGNVHDRRPKKIATLYLGAVFSAGAIFGMAAYRFYAVNTLRRTSRPPSRLRRNTGPARCGKLQNELSLSPEQTAECKRSTTTSASAGTTYATPWSPSSKPCAKSAPSGSWRSSKPEQQEKYRAILEEKLRKREAAQANGTCY